MVVDVILTVIVIIINSETVSGYMSNILRAVINLVETKVIDIETTVAGKNRANSVGDSLELYIKNLFADSFGLDEVSRDRRFGEVFSYYGNQNNPPDIILKGGDAIEVKKIESQFSDLALNSSPPKSKLSINDSRITTSCKRCESWKTKDIIYVVGHVSKGNLMNLSFVYGEDYAASPEIYERISNTIRSGVTSISDIEFKETNELARVNKVDPLGITYLRIRGMWGITNPVKVFSSIYKPINNAKFNFMCIINLDKYNSFPAEDRKKVEELSKVPGSLSVKDVKIKVPDNPAKLKDAKLISFHM